VILESRDGAIHILSLNDPARRNALSLGMFDALDEALGRAARDESMRVLILRGEGSGFCAGFDLAAAAERPAVIADFIARLSRLIRAIRRLPCPVVAAVQGAAIAGGCALLTACDFVIMARDAKVGYPVHALGISPAVTLPTLMEALAPGAARALVMSGRVIDADEAHRIGLATRLSPDATTVHDDAMTLASRLAAFPPHGVRTTKAWLNELDGASRDDHFDAVANDSAALADSEEFAARISLALSRAQRRDARAT
jgi:methylglutaconyl-CoA hydratase